MNLWLITNREHQAYTISHSFLVMDHRAQVKLYLHRAKALHSQRFWLLQIFWMKHGFYESIFFSLKEGNNNGFEVAHFWAMNSSEDVLLNHGMNLVAKSLSSLSF